MAARRFLAPKARFGDGLGYRNQPMRPLPGSADQPDVAARPADATRMCDEPEALDRDDWRRHIDQRAKELEEQRRRFESARIDRERRLMDFEQRLTTAHAEARRRGRDVSSEIRLLRHMQSSGKQVRHLEQRLGAMERKVWRELDEAA